ncbi:HNH endonuclease signature motif containing protein [Streptomyces sp. NPDC055078]
MTEGICSAEGCPTPRRYRELCQRHYDKLKRDRAKRNALRARQRAERPEVTRAYNQRYYAEREADNTERCRRWREQNPERHLANINRWKEANPLRVREHQSARNARRYARIKETSTGPIDFTALLNQYGMVCHICGGVIPGRFDLQFDHVKPLAKGGTHTQDNIRPSHAQCNRKKGAKWHAPSGPRHDMAAD